MRLATNTIVFALVGANVAVVAAAAAAAVTTSTGTDIAKPSSSTARATTITTTTTTSSSSSPPSNPSLQVPACPAKGTIRYDRSVPNRTSFPLTQVELCYDAQAMHLTLTAYNETAFFTNATYTTNDPIYEYEVMEAFVALGTGAPRTYLEFEVAPNNVTYQAFVYNPTKVRTPGAPFDHFFIDDPLVDGLTASTVLDRPAHRWTSTVRVPLGLFNVDDGQARGTRWRMNFFRTVVAPATFPDQLLGAWSVPDAPSFHKTPFFGYVDFV